MKILENKLTDREWQLLLTNSIDIIYKNNEIICREGFHKFEDHDNNKNNINDEFIYKIKRGKIRLVKEIKTKSNSSLLFTMSSFENGTLFGDLSNFLGYYAFFNNSFVADSNEVVVSKLSISFLIKLFKMEPEIAMKFYINIAFYLISRLKTLPSSYKLLGDIRNEGILKFNESPKKVFFF